MKLKVMLLLCVGLLGIGTVQAKPKTAAEWRACRDKVQQSVNVLDVGTAGMDSAVAAQCGAPIVQATTAGRNPAGQHPQAVLRARDWQPKFKALLGSDYAAFNSALEVASKTKQQGEWVLGEGFDPKAGGSVQGFFAIHPASGRIYAALNLGEGAKTYGFRWREDGSIQATGQRPPKALSDWLVEYGQPR